MDPREWFAWTGFFVSTSGFAFTLVKFLVERRDKGLAERKLNEIQRRGESPLFVALSLYCEGLVRPPREGVIDLTPGIRFAAGQAVEPLPRAGAEVSLLMANVHKGAINASLAPGKFELDLSLGQIPGKDGRLTLT